MWNDIVNYAQEWAPALIISALGIILISAINRQMRRRLESAPNSNLSVIGPITTLTLIGTAIIATILTLPIGDAARGQLLGLLGLLVTGAIALSSTTFLGNALAGIMLRAIQSFRPGDYVRVGDHVGRVSELGILHTEIQTEDRDLTTLPNLFLVTNPVTVLRASGTVVSAQVSLGYEVSRVDVEKQLMEAAKRAGLADPFVQVVELGDYSISYRVAGFLTEIKQIITTRSNLRKAMLDSLHEAEIEIVSPTFINQLRLSGSETFLPAQTRLRPQHVENTPEARIFDKADSAEAKAKTQDELEAQLRIVADLEAQISASSFEAERAGLEVKLASARQRASALQEFIE
ncbi:MAG: mechanosensitive ion channel [Myxococcales bacterium]|nr:mechanosensitive ion channel [Myxococcales bacterium]